MPFVAGIIFVVTGLTLMLFGLFLFYAFLPLLFAFIGFDTGLLIGRWLTGEIGATAVVLGVIVAAMFAAASYTLESYRRILLGASMGVLAGLSLAAGLNLEGWFAGPLNLALIVAGGVIGGFFVLYLFDPFVVVASSLSGAALAVAGAHILLQGTGVTDEIDEMWLILLVVVLAAIGAGWQFRKISKWSEWLPIQRTSL